MIIIIIIANIFIVTRTNLILTIVLFMHDV